jgi:hypothetical protein
MAQSGERSATQNYLSKDSSTSRCRREVAGWLALAGHLIRNQKNPLVGWSWQSLARRLVPASSLVAEHEKYTAGPFD